MFDNPQNDFRTTELDPDLLSTPFRVQTNWHVITGAPCCGKTTLIDQLGDKGFRTVAESAREYINLELAKGRTFDDMFGNAADEIRMTELQLGIEQKLQATDVIFLDRVKDMIIVGGYKVFSKEVEEIYMDEGKSGWEGRETGKHK